MPKESRICVILGSGMDRLFDAEAFHEVDTEYGKARVCLARTKESSFYILERHGPGHRIPPHMINYRANISAIKKVGAKRVISTCAVGSMNKSFIVGGMGLITQFLDFTKSRPHTFFDSEVVHTDMTEPYDGGLNSLLSRSARRLGIPLFPNLVYVCAEGPRYESAAEILMFKKLGGDVVGMTGVPEVTLAREIGLRYSSIAIATNWAPGIQKKVSHQEVVHVMKSCAGRVRRLVEDAIESG